MPRSLGQHRRFTFREDELILACETGTDALRGLAARLDREYKSVLYRRQRLIKEQEDAARPPPEPKKPTPLAIHQSRFARPDFFQEDLSAIALGHRPSRPV